MFFLNLSLPEFLAVLGSLSGVVVALYLLDRLRKKHTVATLRFFAVTEKPPVLKHRRKLQQPWSLILQLVSLLLLLLAIAQLRWGSAARASRDHVLISGYLRLDECAIGPGRRTIEIDRPGSRRCPELRPAAALERPRDGGACRCAGHARDSLRIRTLKIRQAIDQTQPGGAALDIGAALEFAQQAQRIRAQQARARSCLWAPDAFPRMRICAAAMPPEFAHHLHSRSHRTLWVAKVSVRRSLSDRDTWDVFVAVKNYGDTTRSVPLGVQFGGAPVGTQRFNLKPGAEESVAFHFKTRAAGWLEARLFTQDAFSEDHRAVLELPGRKVLPVTVYSAEPELLRPVFTAIPGVQAAFQPVSAYNPKISTGIVLLDHFAPPAPTLTDSIWMEPPAAKSPMPVRITQQSVKLKRWRPDHPLGAGLRTKDLQFSNAEMFRMDPDDIAIAESEAGPLIVARPG